MKAKCKSSSKKQSTTKESSLENSTPIYERLPEFDAALLSVIKALGVTHSTVLRILLRTNRFKVNASLRTLWMNGFVHRDIHGLVISTQATDEDPELKEFIEKSFKVHLT